MSRGFTIVEALCAFAILAMVLVALYEVGGTSSRTLVAANGRALAALLAQSKLDELAGDWRLIPPESKGVFEGSETSWRLEAHDIGADKISRHRLQEVTLELRWPDLHGDGRLVVETRHLGSVRQ